MSYREFLSAIFGTNQQQATGQQGYQLPQQADMAQRQSAAIREYQSLYRLQTRYPELLQNAERIWSQPGIENAAYLSIEPTWGFQVMNPLPLRTQWDQDYEEAMREVDEIAPGWKE